MLLPRGRDTALVLAVLIALLFSSATAQSSSSRTSSASSSAPTSSSGPQVHVVDVGINNDFAYHPNVTKAAVGDIVSFHFWKTNHSVTRGVYTDSGDCGPSGCNPCIPFELIHPDQKSVTFNSGNVLTDESWSPGNDSTVFNYTVADETPIWFFCTAISSCSGNGMVGVINPGKSQSIDKQVSTAERVKIELSPSQTWPYKGVPAGALDTATPLAPSPSPSAGPSHVHGLSGGAIAGIAVGAAVVVFLAAALCYFVGRSNTYREVIKHHRSDGAPSQVGDMQSNPTQQSPQVSHGWQDHRISGQTAWSSMSPPINEGPGTFVGYNRQTGAPEFAAEAPVATVDQKTQPPLGHPAFGYQSQQPATYELPGEAPAAAEMAQDPGPKPAYPPR